MPDDATHGGGGAAATRRVARLAAAAAAIGVLVTWTSADGVRLDGVQGPHDGWLVLILAALALCWTRPLARGSWVGVAGVLGAGAVMAWTAAEDWLESRDVLGATAGAGLLLVAAASVALAGAAVARGVELARRRRRDGAAAGACDAPPP